MSRVERVLLAAVVLIALWLRVQPLALAGVEQRAAAAARRELAAELAAAAAPADVGEWIAANRSAFAGRVAEQTRRWKDHYSFAAGEWRVPYLGGLDSYLWLRHASNLLNTGTPCDSVVDEECRDDYTLAPFGVRSRYAESFHVSAIAALHVVLRWIAGEDFPLSLSAFLLSLAVALLAVVPAFHLGRCFGGATGGFVCAALLSSNTVVLYRTVGADNDVWNVFLPLVQMWGAVEAVYAGWNARGAQGVALAAAATGLHAATWSGWIYSSSIVFVGLCANALLVALRRLRHTSLELPAWPVLLPFVYLAAAMLLAWLAGADPAPALGSFASGVFALLAKHEAVAGGLSWPSSFATVGELAKPGLAGIAASTAGTIYFFAAWLGLILLILPRRDWRPVHFIILIGGNLLYRFLIGQSGIDAVTLALFLLLPVAVGLISFLRQQGEAASDQGAGLMISIWFLAGLVLAHSGQRFLILLAPPLAVLCAVSVGRLHEWLARRTQSLPVWTRAVVFAAILAVAWPPLARGFATARRYTPVMNDDWQRSLRRLRDESAADSIAVTWWDYGYFAKYVAERRVLADGGTLSTHVNHWLARALMEADPVRSVGFLRMLACGSDALPEPEGQWGAFGLLLATGMSEADAYRSVDALVGMEREAATAHLLDLGLDEGEAGDVVRRTHCQPPPGYLLLPRSLLTSIGWRTLADTAFVEGGAAAVPPRLYAPDWIDCRRDAGVLRCPVGARIAGRGLLQSVGVSLDSPAAARLRFAGGAEKPAVVRLAGAAAGEVRGTSAAAVGGGEATVLVDAAKRRVLIGSSAVVRSMFVRLFFLDGAEAPQFTLIDAQGGPFDTLKTWRIRW